MHKPEKYYQKFLRECFDSRRARNPSYSLRAFARDLEVHSSKLSQYLNGTCGISAQRAKELAERLNLNKSETELFVLSAEAAHSRFTETRKLAAKKMEELLADTFTPINMEKFNLIRDWYHFAIMELTEVSQFQPDLSWISKSLKLDKTLVIDAVERLKRLELLNTGDGEWVQTHKDFRTPPEVTSRAIRDYHRQMLSLTEKNIETVPVEKREIGSVVFAVDESLLPELKDLVRKTQKDVAALVEKSKSKNSVYTLNLQLMPLFQGENK